MRVIEVSMERQNEGSGGNGRLPRNPPTNGIVRHDSRPGIEPGSPWWEASGLTARLPRPLIVDAILASWFTGGVRPGSDEDVKLRFFCTTATECTAAFTEIRTFREFDDLHARLLSPLYTGASAVCSLAVAPHLAVMGFASLTRHRIIKNTEKKRSPLHGDLQLHTPQKLRHWPATYGNAVRQSVAATDYPRALKVITFPPTAYNPHAHSAAQPRPIRHEVRSQNLAQPITSHQRNRHPVSSLCIDYSRVDRHATVQITRQIRARLRQGSEPGSRRWEEVFYPPNHRGPDRESQPCCELPRWWTTTPSTCRLQSETDQAGDARGKPRRENKRKAGEQDDKRKKERERERQEGKKPFFNERHRFENKRRKYLPKRHELSERARARNSVTKTKTMISHRGRINHSPFPPKLSITSHPRLQRGGLAAYSARENAAPDLSQLSRQSERINTRQSDRAGLANRKKENGVEFAPELRSHPFPGHGCRAVSPLASQQGESGSIPGRVIGFSHVEIVPDDVVGRRVFSVISRLPRPFNAALLHTHFNHPHRLSTPRC
ncbi:hypothetical protein PR048_031101 [Dryococelus australis]|uniref:Uncharacterized protein n=1 Tax=Dryococelus australis TaxID=614101 RepID=A0ABQ9G4C0_9NEOP|nr:hypothetical protein PR048_031101 [Dryococelus australis]